MGSHPRRVHTPTVIQMEAVECGAASLAMILGYFGRYVPLEELRIECGVSRDGSNALNVMAAAEKYGLEADAYQKNEEEILETEVPAIILWEFRHFVVLEGFGKNKAFLNDPAVGRRVISFEEFKESYSGVVLTFSKKEEFKKGGKPKSLFGLVYARLKAAPDALFFLFSISFCVLLPGFAFPALLAAFIDAFFVSNSLEWEWGFIGIVSFFVLFLGVLTRAQFHFLTRLNTKLSMHFSSDFFWHLLKLPMNFYSQRDGGEIAYRMQLNSSVAESLTGPVISTAINLLMIFFFGVIMFFYDVAIASISVAIGAINLISMHYIIRSRVMAYARLQQNMAKSVGQSIGGLQNIETIKSKGIESDFFSRWAGYYTRNINSTQQIEKKDVYLTTFPVFFQSLALASLLGIGSYRIINGSMTVGELMALELLQVYFLSPITHFVGLSSILQNMKKDIERLNDVTNNQVDSIYMRRSSVRKEKEPLRLKGVLEFRDVSFQYTPLAPEVLTKISFTIQPGQKTAIVGPAGSGKTTIARLATGLYYPTSGQILYDGMPIDEISLELFRNSIASINQEIFLFTGSIRDNLTFWNSKVSDEVLIQSAIDACIHDDISLREGGYDSLLIEEGKNLSGGQRQRLEIARALLYSPSLLIMDEATSALDNNTENKVAARIRERGSSVLMIANRLSTIHDCDEILVLDKGAVIQRGTHQELITQEGVYQNLIKEEVYDE